MEQKKVNPINYQTKKNICNGAEKLIQSII